MTLADKFLQMKPAFDSQLFYLWGHSYEFEADDNWQVIRDFCDKMAGQDDIWYATNGEIFAYMEAWRHLMASADGRQVYNPTAVTLWLSEGKAVRTIAPGETISLA